ncbi:MAG: Gfo/Idh/MocA family oxidoreductase [Firmicutes bacterium]|nr:Gfo/Idh/MocA family oxidoreductase [Bacillota bacterium]
MDKWRVALIGCGGIAHGKHLPALAAREDVKLVGFCDLELDRARRAAVQYGTPDAIVTTDYRAVLTPAVDIVYVLTTNDAHAALSIAALEAGKHVLCEKPMAVTSAEAEAMVAAAKTAGKILTVGFQSRFRADVQYLKQLCDAGELGHIYFAKALAVRRRGVPTWGSFLSRAKQGGGPLIDIGSHALDLTLWLMNNYAPRVVMGATHHELAREPHPANAWGPWDPAAFTVEEAAFGMIQMANGATILLEATWALNTLDVGEAQAVLCGTKAGADMKDGLRINGEHHGRLYTFTPEMSGGGVAFFAARTPEDTGRLEIEHFLRAVRGEAEPVVKPEETLVVTRILEALYQSAERGEPVFLASPPGGTPHGGPAS